MLAVAGALGTSAAWTKVMASWKAALAEQGLTTFHMTDFENGRAGFDGWSQSRRLVLLGALIRAIHSDRPRVMAFSSAVVLEHYDALSPEEQKALGTPYELCAFWSIRLVGSFLNRNRAKGLVQYTFEDRPRKGSVQDVCRKALGTVAAERRLAGVQFLPKAACSELEVADLMAYEASKDALRVIGAESRPTRRSLLALMGGVYARGYLFDAPTLRRVLDARLAPLDASDLKPRRESKKGSA